MRQSSCTEKLRSNSVFPKQDGMHKVNFKVQENEFLRLSKAFVGLVENSRILYNEGYFSIHVTPLGVNICLLEDRVE